MLATLAAAVGLSATAGAETFTLETATIADIQAAMDAGALTSVELVSLYLNRLSLYDRSGIQINAVPVLNPAVLAQAQAADDLRAAGTVLGPLHGVGLLVKDNINVAGLPNTNGYIEMLTSVPASDAFVVQQLRAAGAVVIGKTNLPDGAGAQSVSSAYGITKNPYGLTFVAGGSSTGSAAGVAANFGTIALGSDSAGSLISPAAANNLFTLTPSLGVVGRSGSFPGAEWRNVIGVLGRSAFDVAVAMNDMDADDPNELYRDFFAPFEPPRGVNYTAQFGGNALAGRKIGIYRAYLTPALPAEITATFERFVEELRAAGATVVDYNGARPTVATPSTASVIFDRNAYLLELPASAPANNIAEWAQLLTPRVNTQATTDAIVAAFNADQLVPWQQNQSLLDYRTARLNDRATIQAALVSEGFDALINPATTNLVPAYTPSATVLPAGTSERWTGFPLVVVPAGVDGNGLPIGMQFVGRAGADATILALADAYARQKNYRTPPALTPALPGETIEYSTAVVPPPGRRETAPPAIRIAGVARVAGSGRRASLVFSGAALDASGIGSLAVYVNGRKIAANRARNWLAVLRGTALRTLTSPGDRTVNVLVVAKDRFGNTAVQTKAVRLPGRI